MSQGFGTRLRGWVAALVVVGASLAAVAPVANAATFEAGTTEQFEEAVTKANANTEKNTILVKGGVAILPLKTETFTNKSGVQTIEGPAAQPGAKLEGSAVEPFPSPLFTVGAGVTLALKKVEVSHSSAPGVPAIEALTEGHLTIEQSGIEGNKGIGMIINPGASVSMTNSTVSDQAAGGVVNSGTATFVNDTIALNKGTGIETKGTLGLTNTIVAENTGGNCVGKATTQDHSLDSDGTCGVEKSSVNPLLSGIQLNGDGGPVPIHSLKPGSPAIDAGDTAACPTVDQRGIGRPDVAATACDIGADEFNETKPTIKVPANFTVGDTSSKGAVVPYAAEATTPVAAIQSFSCTPASGATFGFGTTTVECSAVDGHENKSTATFTVTVRGLRWFLNEKLLTVKHEPAFALGEITLKNPHFTELKCHTFLSSGVWNEGSIGFQETVGFATWECKATQPCEVTNERGVKKEGTFMTAEGPPSSTEKQARHTGNTSLPWTQELVEKEGGSGVHSVQSHKMKIWVDVPVSKALGGPGEGAGCEALGGTETPFEDQEGAAEKEEGDELAPKVTDGAANGLSPSHGTLSGEKVSKKTEEKKQVLPKETGRLVSPTFGPAYVTGESTIAGGSDFELATVE